MKRDMDLVRQILLHLEQGGVRPGHIELPGRPHQEVVYHIELMDDAGLLVANVSHYPRGQSDAYVQRMTWTGHEFIELARDERRWKSATKAAGLAFEVLRAALIERARHVAGLDPGHDAGRRQSRPQGTGQLRRATKMRAS